MAHFDVSRTGTLVYRKAGGGAADRVTTIQWLDAAGKKEPLLAKPGTYGDLSLSPDGKRLAVDGRGGSSRDIWVYDPQRDAMTRLTFGGGIYVDPIWSPDGRYVVFGSGTGGMFWTRADGAGQPRTLTQSKNDQPSSFSPDGKRLAYNEFNSESGCQLADLDCAGRGQRRPVEGGKAGAVSQDSVQRPFPRVLTRRAMAGV